MTAAPRRRDVLRLVAYAAALGMCVAVSARAHGSTPQPHRPGLRPTAHDETCGDTPFRSLRPGALPRPRHMPPGTLMRTIQARGRLVVGVDESLQGLGYSREVAAPPAGLDIDLLQEVARAILGRPRVEYASMATRRLESAIADDRLDVVGSAFSITCARRRRMQFSSVYYRGRQRLLVPSNSGIRELSDRRLHGRRICAPAGSSSLERLRRQPRVVAVPEDPASDCLAALQENSVAAVTADEATLFGLRRQDPTMAIVGRCLGIERYAMAMNKDQRPFVRFVNALLARLRDNGRAKLFRERWLKGVPTPPEAAIARCDRRASRMGS